MSGFLFRLDGVGNDHFLPIWPFTLFKMDGLNYSRCGIGILAWLATGNLWHIPAYIIAANIPYSEKCWLSKYPLSREFNFLIYGFFMGLASFSWGNAVFCSLLFFILMELSKFNRLNHAVLEVLFGFGCCLFYLWR